MPRFLLLLVVAVLLTACARATPTATPVPTPTMTPTATVTATLSPTATASATPTATVNPNALTDLEREYMALLMVESCIDELDQLAARIQAGNTDDREATGALIGLVFVLNSILKGVDGSSLVGGLEPAWAEAQGAVELAGGVMSMWINGEITPVEFTKLLKPAAEQAANALEMAGREMTAELGVTENEMVELRETVEASFRASPQVTPAPPGGS